MIADTGTTAGTDAGVVATDTGVVAPVDAGTPAETYPAGPYGSRVGALFRPFTLTACNRTGDYARNWRRIARTELQGVANDGAAIEALRTYGAEARVARIPNADACPDCRRLFLGDDGKPRIFTVAELVGNGVNVGRARRDWVASLWPVHPNCNCTTQSIPPGMRFADDWGLELAA